MASLQDWVARLDALDATAVVDSYIVRQLGISGGVVTINLVGTDAAVSNALAVHIQVACAMTAPLSSSRCSEASGITAMSQLPLDLSS